MRVAVFFTPPRDHPLTRVAAAWLGRDAFSGLSVAPPPVAELDADEVHGLTAFPRRYGFHATLKPPFAIAEGHSIEEIEADLASFCRDRESVTIPALRVERIGAFFALTPAVRVGALDRLADDLVRRFDAYRAPTPPEELARRDPERLTPRQRHHLDLWGYPYVFEEFRFHMTLTGPVPKERRGVVEGIIRARFETLLGRPLTVDAVSLFAEPDPPGEFVVRAHQNLAKLQVVEAP